MEGRIQVPTLNEGEELSIGKQLVIIDKFLRWGPLLENHAVEIYRVKSKSSRQDDTQFYVRTLRKIPLASKRLLHASVQELNTLKAFRQCGNHPNIVSLVDGAFYPNPSGLSKSNPLERYDVYFLFEDEEIGTLADFLGLRRKQNGTICEGDLLALLLPVCEAVAFLHTFRPPLLHRNIRLSNVILTSDNTLKLSGFLGIAFELPPGKMSAEDKRAIIEDLACYTEPRYRAPEVLYPTSRLGINTKSDIWAIGVLLFVAAFERSPFQSSDPMDIVNTKYSFPRLEYPYIMEIIDTLLQKSPKSRPDIFEVIATIKSMLEDFRTLDHFDHSTRDLAAIFGGKIPPFQVPRRSYMWHDPKKGRRTGISKARPFELLHLPLMENEDSLAGAPVASDQTTHGYRVGGDHESYLSGAFRDTTIAVDLTGGNEPQDTGRGDGGSASECDVNEPGEGAMTEARSGLQGAFRVDNAVGLYLGLASQPPPFLEYPSAGDLRSSTPKPEDETPTASKHDADPPARSKIILSLEDSSTTKDEWVPMNLGEEPNRVQSTPPSPIHPSPPPPRLKDTPTSEKAPLVESRPPSAQGLPIILKTQGSGAGSPAAPDSEHKPTPGTQSLINELPVQGYPEDLYDSANDLEESSGCSTPRNRGEMEDGQVNAAEEEGLNSDHELPNTPPESVDQPSPNSSCVPDDIGSSILTISEDPVRINGSFCDVFVGTHSTAGKVALKRPRIGGTGDDEETIKSFEREAATWRRLQHPHILNLFGTFKRNKHLYFVSPFMDNGTLVEYTALHPDVNRIRLLCETADALRYVHANGVVHGDIKGSNILIDDNVRCLLCDFGLSKVTQSRRTSTSMRGVGTFRWQSPELWFDAPKSFSSDTYAFAITIAEVLAGEAPFAYLQNDTAVMVAVLNNNERPPKKPLESLAGVSYNKAWEVAEACWPRIPEERISMAVAFERLRADPSFS